MEFLNLGKLGDDVFGDSVSQVFVLFGAADVFEIDTAIGRSGAFHAASTRPELPLITERLRPESRSLLRRSRSVLNSVADW